MMMNDNDTQRLNSWEVRLNEAQLLKKKTKENLSFSLKLLALNRLVTKRAET